MNPIVRHLMITGRVQGVGFRMYMERAAHEIGINGWVRNRRDGSVEAMVSGAPDAVENIIAWARRGPRSATVNGVEVSEATGNFSDFDTLPTA